VLIRDILKLKPVDEDVGVEIEMEGQDFPEHGETYGNWHLTEDNSLRGESGEFVLRKPVFIKDLPKALDQLQDTLDYHETVVYNSHRAGVHVHINVQNLSLRQLVAMVALYSMFEKGLMTYCDPTRRGNHFCLPFSDASGVLDLFKESLESGRLLLLKNDDIRYSNFNFTSLFKYGSVEIRSLESTQDFSKINTWANLLLCLREFAKTVKVPTDLFATASGAGYNGFVEKVFGKWADIIRPLMNENDFYDGIRNIQHTVHAIDWTSHDLNIFSLKKNIFLGT
jgi:hypothetical protein